jgi:transcriptional regulator with XRE-family HTH domain
MTTKLEALRKQAGMSQFEMAIALKCSINSYRLWEYGVMFPNKEHQKRIDDFFGMEVKIGEIV